MAMNSVIQRRRKDLGLTQEQLADYLGVTAPAVNKWEKGTSCPDISLLAPLARLLKINMNTLFEFEREISQKELVHFCREISRCAQERGYEPAFELAEEKLHEYPGSDSLLHNMALQLQSLLVSAGLDEEKNKSYLAKINGWYLRLTESEDAVIRNSALYMMASYEISMEHYEKAQEYLDRMPNRNDTPDKRMLQAAIFMKQDGAEAAARLMQAALLSAVGEVQMILFRLADAELALENLESAEYAARCSEETAHTFDLNEYNSLVAYFQIAAAQKNADKTVSLLRRMLKSGSKPWELSASPLYSRITASSGASIENLIVPLLESMMQSEEYSFLHNDENFKALLDEYEIKASVN